MASFTTKIVLKNENFSYFLNFKKVFRVSQLYFPRVPVQPVMEKNLPQRSKFEIFI